MSVNVHAEQPGRPSQTKDEMSKLDENISMLHNAISDLDSRLTDVLIPNDQSDTVKLAEPRQLLVPHATQLQTHNDSIVEAHARIRDILGRLEL